MLRVHHFFMRVLGAGISELGAWSCCFSRHKQGLSYRASWSSGYAGSFCRVKVFMYSTYILQQKSPTSVTNPRTRPLRYEADTWDRARLDPCRQTQWRTTMVRYLPLSASPRFTFPSFALFPLLYSDVTTKRTLEIGLSSIRVGGRNGGRR